MEATHRAALLLPGAWRLIAVEREPPVEVLGTYAVRAITRVTDRVHADALGLIDELLAVGADARRCACHGRRRSEPDDHGELAVIVSLSAKRLHADRTRHEKDDRLND